MSATNKYASPEQIRFAKVMSAGVRVGFILLVVSFILYMTGIVKPLVPVHHISVYWHMSAAEYAKATGSPTGWGWVKDFAKGDILNYFGIVVLASVSMVSTLALIPLFLRQGEKLPVVLSILLVAVLLVSASNILH